MVSWDPLLYLSGSVPALAAHKACCHAAQVSTSPRFRLLFFVGYAVSAYFLVRLVKSVFCPVARPRHCNWARSLNPRWWTTLIELKPLPIPRREGHGLATVVERSSMQPVGRGTVVAKERALL